MGSVKDEKDEHYIWSGDEIHGKPIGLMVEIRLVSDTRVEIGEIKALMMMISMY